MPTDPVVRRFGSGDRAALVDLWQRCGLTRPWNDPGRDIDRKLALDPAGLLVATLGTELCGSVMVGYDGHRGWVNYLAVDPDRQRAGLGRLLMRSAESLLAERGCAKVNLQVRTSNVEAVRFYESIGYELDDVVSMGRRLTHDAD